MATDYISRQSAINIVCDDECDDCPDGGCDMYRRLKRLPAADAVDVVRCKDCRYFYNNPDEMCCINHRGVVKTDENGYCHHAERKEKDG